MIGIGITTHNRSEVFLKTYNQMAKYLPADAKLIVVDDASEIPALYVDYRFEENVGIARAKNKCLELLEDCEHIFLFDDDTYPLKADWWKPYVNSKEPHLMYSFTHWANGNSVGDDKIVYKDDEIEAHVAARGCMIYLHKSVLDSVGGFDVNYGKAMHEHIDFSNRIFNAGLTSFKFMDVVEKGLIYSADEHKDVISSIPRSQRSIELQKNLQYYEAQKNSSRYIEFRDKPKEKKKTNNVILTTYFTSDVDVQRGERWKADWLSVKPLTDSIYEKSKVKTIVLHDCFDITMALDIRKVNLKKVHSYGNPYFMRWYAQYNWLKEHPEIDNVFCVDATDVTMLNSPFEDMVEGIIYIGDEASTLYNKWLISNASQQKMRGFFMVNRTLPLLNCGVVGGSRRDVMELCRKMYALCYENPNEVVDMPPFNYLMYTEYAHKIHHGRDVTNVFKSFKPTEEGKEWFNHK